jgi:hypothetical protein
MMYNKQHILNLHPGYTNMFKKRNRLIMKRNVVHCWSSILPISTKQTTTSEISHHITEHESRILPISTKQTTTSHIISLNMNQEFYQYQQNKQLPLTPYHWTWIKNSTNINKTNNYLSYHITEHESRILPISTKQTTTSEVSHHITEHESRILPISTKQTTTSRTISLNMNQEFYQYQFNLIIVPGETD